MRIRPCFRNASAWIALLASLPVASSAQPGESFQPKFLPSLEIRRAEGPIRIDGELGDEGWRGAAVASGFSEVSPGDQVEPPVQSEAWVTYDDSHLYVALIARDDPDRIRVSLTERDAIFRDDYFGIMLDTYGDQSWGYELFVNPIGIQGDMRLQSSGGEDESFDLIWDSEGHVTDDGYQVEIAVPFSSLRFPDQPVQTWRINFWRDHQREVRRRYAWAAQDRDNPCFLCQWGTLNGIEGIRPGRRVEAIAAVIGSQAGALEDASDPRSAFENETVTGDASLNLKYSLSSTSTAEFALNPDFSQVESDAGRIDVNSTFALFFPERRPFFQEGSNLYNTWIDAVYTRSINDPQLAGKITGQSGKTQFLYLAARDESSPVILPSEERSAFLLLDESVTNVMRVRRSLREESYVGALVTDRRLEAGGSGSLISADALFRILTSYRVELQAAVSRTDEPDDASLTDGIVPTAFGRDGHTTAFDGEDFWGSAFYASLERSASFWSFDFDYWEYDPEFRTDNGFTTRNDFRQVSGWTEVSFRPNKPWLVEWEPSVSVGRIWSHDNRFKDEWVRPQVWFSSKGQTQFGTQYLFSKERFGPGTFPGIRIWSGWMETRPHERIGTGFNFDRGRGIFRSFDDPELADQTTWGVFLNLKPSQRMELELDWDYAAMHSRERDEELFAGWILRNRLTFNFTRQWFLRLVTQYDEFRDRLDVEPLLTYRINPFTVFFVGSTNRILRFDSGEFDVIDESRWRSSERQYFAKLQYLLRI